MKKIIAIIPASGYSSRFKSDKPKQYHILLDTTILEKTLQSLANNKDIDKIYIAVNPDDKYIFELDFSKIHHAEILFCGGNTRAETVFNSLKLIDCNDDDYVMVHDAARCLLHSDDLAKLINEADDIGAILGTKSTDTIKLVDDKINITQTLDREFIYQAQTPQMFRYDVLYNSYEKADLSLVTDEASVIEANNYKVKIIQSMHPNFKVTYPLDLVLARIILTKFED